VKNLNRWFAILLAVAGAGLCMVALIGFVATIVQNNLPWSPDQGIRDHYLAVGQSYSQGFTIGFFLCFFLTLIAVSVAALVQHRREAVTDSARPKGPAPSPHPAVTSD
jgi:ABC-type Fe3+ transport system permease subunit